MTATKTKAELLELLNTEGVQAFNAYRRTVGYDLLDMSQIDFFAYGLDRH